MLSNFKFVLAENGGWLIFYLKFSHDIHLEMVVVDHLYSFLAPMHVTHVLSFSFHKQGYYSWNETVFFWQVKSICMTAWFDKWLFNLWKHSVILIAQSYLKSSENSSNICKYLRVWQKIHIHNSELSFGNISRLFLKYFRICLSF